jgi:ankyrin repeat protein
MVLMLMSKMSKKKSALLHAARVGDVSLIQTLLDCGAAIDHADRLRYTPLLLCQLYKNRPSVQLLLEGGANVNVTSIYRDTPLHQAYRARDTNMVKVLLEKGACVDPHPGFTSPLHAALSHWRDIKRESDGEETVRLLLEAGAEPNATCPREDAPQLRHTPLMRAIASASITVVKLLLDHTANFKPKVEQKWSPLNSAENKSSAEMVKLLLEAATRMTETNI